MPGAGRHPSWGAAVDDMGILLVGIGLSVLSGVLLLLALLALETRERGLRQAVRHIWEGALVVSVYFGVGFFGVAAPLRWSYNWCLLLSHYSVREVAREGLAVQQVVKHPETVIVFSNGERRPMRLWPNLLHGALFFSWWGLDLWITTRIARRFAPTVWAEFSDNRGGTRCNPDRGPGS